MAYTGGFNLYDSSKGIQLYKPTAVTTPTATKTATTKTPTTLELYAAQQANKDKSPTQIYNEMISPLQYSFLLNQREISPNIGTGTGNDTSGGGGSGGADYSGVMSSYAAMIAQQKAAAEAAAAEKQKLAQQAYDTNYAALQKAYENRGSLLSSNLSDTMNMLQSSYDYGKGKSDQSAESALQQAYINRMKSERELPQQLAALGLSGGASETTLAELKNNYGNSRQEINKQLADTIASLLQTLNSGKSSAQQAYNSQLASDSTAKTNEEIALQQALTSGLSDVLTSKYDTLSNLDQSYMDKMLELQQAQASAAASAANAQYKASNAAAEKSQEQAYNQLVNSAAYNRAKTLFQNGMSIDETAADLEAAGFSAQQIDQVFKELGA